MELGIALPQFGDGVDDAARIGEFAARAEEAGAASLWVGDRLLAARDPVVGYGGSDTLPVEFRRVLDPFALLAAAAVTTRRVTLGASVLVGPIYPPAVLARALGTVSALSGGRLIAGMGIGWSPEEYAGAGVGFDQRGARLDELLDVLATLWSPEPAGHEGRFWSLPAVHVDVPEPRALVYLAAFSDAALRRVARRADGWLPVAVVPAVDLDGTVAAIARRRRTIDDDARAGGRDPATIGTALRVNVTRGASAGDVADAVPRLVEATGITDVFVDPMYVAPGVDDRLALLETLLARTGS